MFLLTSCNVIKKGFKFKLNGKNSLNLQLGLVLNHAVSSFKWDQFHLFNNELCRQVDSRDSQVSHCFSLYYTVPCSTSTCCPANADVPSDLVYWFINGHYVYLCQFIISWLYEYQWIFYCAVVYFKLYNLSAGF